jgi:hypothetical protein
MDSVGAVVSRVSGVVVSGLFDIEMDCCHFVIKRPNGRNGASLLCYVIDLA